MRRDFPGSAGAHKVAGRADMYKRLKPSSGRLPNPGVMSIMGPAKRLGCHAVADECICF